MVYLRIHVPFRAPVWLSGTNMSKCIQCRRGREGKPVEITGVWRLEGGPGPRLYYVLFVFLGSIICRLYATRSHRTIRTAHTTYAAALFVLTDWPTRSLLYGWIICLSWSSKTCSVLKKSWDTVVHILFSFQHVTQLKPPCMRRSQRRRTTIVTHLNSSVSYFNFHMIST